MTDVPTYRYNKHDVQNISYYSGYPGVNYNSRWLQSGGDAITHLYHSNTGNDDDTAPNTYLRLSSARHHSAGDDDTTCHITKDNHHRKDDSADNHHDAFFSAGGISIALYAASNISQRRR